jgi:hypothetical protein
MKNTPDIAEFKARDKVLAEQMGQPDVYSDRRIYSAISRGDHKIGTLTGKEEHI